MTNPKYKCEKHELNIVCIYCVRAKCLKLEKLLEFVKSCVDAEGAYQPQDDAKELLQEIGEIE